MWFVYILKSEIYNKSYVGSTNNFDRRLSEHNSGKGIYTRRYKPWKLIKLEEYSTYAEARKREYFLKTGVGRNELKTIFNVRTVESESR